MSIIMFILIFLGVSLFVFGISTLDSEACVPFILFGLISLVIGFTLMFGGIHYIDKIKVNKYTIAELPSFTFIEAENVLMTCKTDEERKNVRETKSVYLVRQYNYWKWHINDILELSKE